MKPGLLWFDNEPTRTVAAKATAAAERYQQKYGVTPEVCYVNARTLKDGELSIPFGDGQLRLIPVPNILVNHFWIGQGGV